MMDERAFYRHLIDEGVSEQSIESLIGEGWSIYQIYAAEVEGGNISAIISEDFI